LILTALEKHLHLYFGLSNDALKAVASLFIESDLKKGDYFIKTNQYCEKLSFIQTGFIRIYKNYNDKEITQWISCENYFITELNSFVFQQRSRLNMQALTDCKLYSISTKDYKTLHTVVPNWQFIEKQFISSCFITLEDRVFQHLSLTAEERYDEFFANHKEMFNQVPLQYIASMLGMSPETFSRIRNKKSS